ncbi:hypothetical protein ABBQ38_013098 [Trebouxia sp. C0009 RCD-2024]
MAVGCAAITRKIVTAHRERAIQAVKEASHDDRVRGLIAHIKPDEGIGDLAAVQELRNAVMEFRQAYQHCLRRICSHMQKVRPARCHGQNNMLNVRPGHCRGQTNMLLTEDSEPNRTPVDHELYLHKGFCHKTQSAH